jgi:hypothetical protein
VLLDDGSSDFGAGRSICTEGFAWRPLPINVTPVKINNDIPSYGELRGIIGELTNGWVAGASGMHVKHVKEWLHGTRWEEDPESQGAKGAGDSWCLFVWLVQATWNNGVIMLNRHLVKFLLEDHEVF